MSFKYCVVILFSALAKEFNQSLNPWTGNIRFIIYREALCDLVSFVQFEKREKYPWKSVTLVKLEAFASCKISKSNTPP